MWVSSGRPGQLANAGARVVAGELCDRVGTFRALWGALALILISGFVAQTVQFAAVLTVVAFLVLGGYGATLAIYPIITLKEYGSWHLGANYGIIFNAWACGYIAGGYLGPRILDTFGGYAGVFYAAMFTCLIAVLLAGKAAELAGNTVVNRPIYHGSP